MFSVFEGADSSRISALFVCAFANSCGGGMRLFQASDFGAQELKVKVSDVSMVCFPCQFFHDSLNFV